MIGRALALGLALLLLATQVAIAELTADDIGLLNQDDFDEVWRALGKVAWARGQAQSKEAMPRTIAQHDDDIGTIRNGGDLAVTPPRQSLNIKGIGCTGVADSDLYFTAQVRSGVH